MGRIIRQLWLVVSSTIVFTISATYIARCGQIEIYEKISSLIALSALFVTTISLIVIYKTYINSTAKSKLENSFRIVDVFDKSFNDKDIENWKRMFHGWCDDENNIPEGCFNDWRDPERQLIDFGACFIESPEHYKILPRMADFFEMVFKKAEEGGLDIEYLFYEIGQYMSTTHSWLLSIKNTNSEFWPDLNKIYPNFINGLQKKNYKDTIIKYSRTIEGRE